MDGAYDEIISENPFYIEFKKQYHSFFQHCISQNWIICVPRIGSFDTRVFSTKDFCAHVLVQNEELPETNYSTLTEKQVTVTNKVITLEVTKELPLQSHILFEETFYTEDHMKYKVWCIETPLDPSLNRHKSNCHNERLTSLNDCINLLWNQTAGRYVLDQIELRVQLYIKKNQSSLLAIASLKDSLTQLYMQCLQIALQNKRLREQSKLCKQILDNIKLSVETYMQHLLFNNIFKSICTCSAYEDSHLNKTIRNLSDIQLRDLDIKRDLYPSVPKAKQILSKINDYTTILEKLMCIKMALNAIKKTDNVNDKDILLTADDMLPVFVFIVIKSGLPNWYSQLTYIKEFRFSCISKGEGNESDFLTTTLEAVINYIQSGVLTGPPNPEAYYYESDLTEDQIGASPNRKNSLTESVSTSDTVCGEETLEYIFELIKSSHVDQIKIILKRNQQHLSKLQQNFNGTFDLKIDLDDDDENDTVDAICHPLCYCKKCNRRISRNLLKTCPTVASRDSHGLTPLHIASIHGRASVVEVLIELGAEINATDINECTPLHYAASRGNQNALLLLLHTGTCLNSVDIDRNTPLHLAVNNGHLNCVKALIYYAEHSRKQIKINYANDKGDTPLHMASKWGYEGIAKILIENGSEPSLQNTHNKSAFDYAHNLRILHILQSCTPSLYEFIHINNTDVQNLNVQSKSPKQNIKMTNITNTTLDVSKTVDNLTRIDRILKAISYGDIKLACFYMNIEYDIYTSNDITNNMVSTNCHPLCECIYCQRKNNNIDFNVNFSNTYGQTPLHCAAEYGSEELCNILLINNANINCTNINAETPLHLAALTNKISVVRLLLDKGANVNASDSLGNTPLHNASQCGNIGATKIIINYNPDVTILNGCEKTALDIAKDKVFLTIIDILETYIMRT